MNSYFDKNLNSKIFYNEPLFLIEINEKKGGNYNYNNYNNQNNLYYQIKKNVNLRRKFINALHLSTDQSWEILHETFLKKKDPILDKTNLSYVYLDDIAEKFIDKNEVLDFPLVDVKNIEKETKEIHKKYHKKTLIIKTHDINENTEDIIKYWYDCLNISYDFENENMAWLSAGFEIEEEFIPKNPNPLGIKFIKLTS